MDKKESDVSIQYHVNTMFQDINVPIFLAASSFFYSVEQLISHPLEVIRTRLQANRNTTSLELFRSSIKNSGFRSLYVGFLPATLGHMPGSLIYILSYTFLKDRLQKLDSTHVSKRHDGSIAPWVSFTAALLADVSAVAFYCPVDVVAQRLFLQSNGNPVYKSAREAVQDIVKKEGIRGLYKGSGVAIVNSVPASAIWWTSYEHFKVVFAKRLALYKLKRAGHDAKDLHGQPLVIEKHWLPQILSGMLSGSIITIVTNPLDLVRTRLQTQTFTHAASEQYKGSLDVIKSVWRREGMRGFTKGIIPRWTSWTIFSCTSAFLYEFIMDISANKK